MTPFPRFALRTLPALFLSLGCLAATVQAAEAVRYRFSQAAAPLAQALNAFSRASGQTLLYTAELPPQATAPALHGSLDAEEALQRLLQGSGLRARRIDERTLTLEPIPASGALDLDATTVSAAAPAQGYRPAANASISRGDAPVLEIPRRSAWSRHRRCRTSARATLTTRWATSAASPRPTPSAVPRTR